MSHTILAFCVCEDWCYTALKLNNRIHTLMKPITKQNTQATLLIPTIRTLWEKYKKPKPDVIITVRGPGSFTSTRIAIAAAQGFSTYFSQAKCFAPTTNILLTHMVKRNKENPILTLVNSRRGDFYAQIFKSDNKLYPLQTLSLEQIQTTLQENPSLKVTGDFNLNKQTDNFQNTLKNRWIYIKDNWASGLIQLYLEKQSNITPDECTFAPLYLYNPNYKKSDNS